MRLKSVVSIFAIWILASTAQAAEPSFATIQTFDEKINSEVNVSGHVIVGLMGSQAFQGIQQKTLAISASALKKGDSLCLKVSSRDGVYLLDGQYAIDSEPAQQVMLEYPTKKLQIVEAFERDTVAVAARLGACDSSVQHYLLPFFAETAPTEVLLAINGFEATDVFYSVQSADGQIAQGECEYLDEGRHTAYDYACVVPLAEGSESYQLAIERELYGRELPAVELHLQR